MKVVNYSINTFYVLKMAISLRSLNSFLKKWEFKHLGSFPGLVPFQGDYGYAKLPWNHLEHEGFLRSLSTHVLYRTTVTYRVQ